MTVYCHADLASKDLGEFDQQRSVRTKWGTKQELKDLVAKAKEVGIVTYIDAVLNHKAGADETETFKAREVEEQDRTKYKSEAYDIDGWTKFDFPGRGDKYSKMKWRFHHFTGVDWDQKGEKKAIFKIMGQNKDWGEADDTLGNYGELHRKCQFLRFTF
jgi:alpha-amylase